MKRQISRWNFAQARTNPGVAWCESGSVTTAPVEQRLLKMGIRDRMEAGYIVRWLPGQGIPQALRMTIGTEDETRGLAAAIRAAIAAG